MYVYERQLMNMLVFDIYEFSTPFAITCWKCVVCCHAFALSYFLYVVLWALETWFWGFWVTNSKFCRSGL